MAAKMPRKKAKTTLGVPYKYLDPVILADQTPAILTHSYIFSGESNVINPLSIGFFIDDMTDDEFTAITVAGIAILKAMGKL